MSEVLSQIMSKMGESREQGFEPIILVLNKDTKEKIIKSLGEHDIDIPLTKILGLDVHLDERVPDFFVVDNRSWVYQKM